MSSLGMQCEDIEKKQDSTYRLVAQHPNPAVERGLRSQVRAHLQRRGAVERFIEVRTPVVFMVVLRLVAERMQI